MQNSVSTPTPEYIASTEHTPWCRDHETDYDREDGGWCARTWNFEGINRGGHLVVSVCVSDGRMVADIWHRQEPSFDAPGLEALIGALTEARDILVTADGTARPV